MTEKDIITKYLGIPYLHQGRGLDGLDCYGLIINIYKDFGIPLIDINDDYNKDWSWQGRDYFIENAHRQWQEIKEPKFLDMVIFKNGKGIMNHAGIMFDGNRFIHTCKAGTVISRVNDFNKKQRLNGYYRFKYDYH